MTVRLALGASTGRLIRDSIVEAGLLCLGGSAVGLLLGHWITRVLVTLAPPDMVPTAGISLNATVLAFAGGACAVCIALVGIGPAVHVARAAGRAGVRADLRAATAHGGAFAPPALGSAPPPRALSEA